MVSKLQVEAASLPSILTQSFRLRRIIMRELHDY
jgi:hypothetical protein